MIGKKLVPCIFIHQGKAVKWFDNFEVISEDVVSLAKNYDLNGADELLVYCKNDPVVLKNNGSHFEKLSSLYEAGEISKSAVDEAAKRFYDYMDIWDTDSDEIKYAYFKYLWYTKWSVDDSSRSESLRREFIRYRDRLEQDGLKIPDWVDE